MTAPVEFAEVVEAFRARRRDADLSETGDVHLRTKLRADILEGVIKHIGLDDEMATGVVGNTMAPSHFASILQDLSNERIMQNISIFTHCHEVSGWGDGPRATVVTWMAKWDPAARS